MYAFFFTKIYLGLISFHYLKNINCSYSCLTLLHRNDPSFFSFLYFLFAILIITFSRMYCFESWIIKIANSL